MSQLLDDDLGALLRGLAVTAAPAVTARPDLAAVVLARPRRRRPAQAWALPLAGLLATGAVAAAVLPGQHRYVRVYEPSGSMVPTVPIAGEVLADRSLRPVPGDLVIERARLLGTEQDLVRRVVAVGGQTVACPDDGNGVCLGLVVDGMTVPEPFLAGGPGAPFVAELVPAGQVFLLGDARDNAVDSRQQGPAPASSITAVVVRIVDAGGGLRPVPGAPVHAAPGGGDDSDPAGDAPAAAASPA